MSQNGNLIILSRKCVLVKGNFLIVKSHLYGILSESGSTFRTLTHVWSHCVVSVRMDTTLRVFLSVEVCKWQDRSIMRRTSSRLLNSDVKQRWR